MTKIKPCKGRRCEQRDACLRYALSHSAKRTDEFVRENYVLVDGRQCPKFITNKTV